MGFINAEMSYMSLIPKLVLLSLPYLKIAFPFLINFIGLFAFSEVHGIFIISNKK